MSAGRGGGRGTGRGALIRQLLGSQSSGSLSHEDPEGTGSTPHTDSGVGQSSSPSTSSKSPDPQTRKVSGRGKLLEQLSASSDSSGAAKPTASTSTSSSGARGRAKLLQSLLSAKSSDSPEEPTTGTYVPVVSGRGRGRIYEDTTQVSEAEIEKGVQDLEISEAIPAAEPEAVIKRGSKGTAVKAVCNYIRLHSNPDKGVFEYEVRFSPPVDSKSLRVRLLNEHRAAIGGTKTFDGVTLYLPILLPDKITILQSTNKIDNSQVEVKIIFKRKKPLRECIHLYNVLFDRVMKTLNYVRFDRKQFDPSKPKLIPQHKLEVWPGYITAVDEYEGGIMLCCDVSHRLLCQTTVLDTLKDIYHANPQLFQENAKKALLGSVVLTRYNNKTYRIDDINFASNPQATFKQGDREVSYLEYYKAQYNITITEHKQPLLINIKERRVANKETPEELMFCLIPEICYLTGLRDDLRSDFKVMRDIATFTRVTPNQRIAALQKFYTNVNNCPEAREILADWGLTLSESSEKVIGRQFEEEIIFFARKQVQAGQNADFGRHATNNELLEVVNISNWLLIHTKNDMRYAKAFIDCIERNSRPMGMQVCRPQVHVLQSDRTEAYVNALRELIKPNVQIVVLICPTSRDDRYAAIKKICCAEIPIPSQVINSRTLSNESKNRSIIQKITLQMNCKLGGTLWSVKIPFRNVMICGIDSYHEAGNRGNSVAAFVASLNETYTKWYSRAVIQTRKEEVVNGLCASLKQALQAYEKRNKCLPDKIIIFRDGVGDGQLKVCAEYEVPQFEAACKIENPDYNPTLTFIVVQKRINTRIFMDAGNEYQNPNPGFVLDHTVTRKYLYDFFLISQSVRQGTVSPTHFVVVFDTGNFSPDILQRLSYKLCFLYYNWPGTVRVPACCQYAHKLAYLIGQSVKKQNSEKLADKLFYL